MARSAVFRFSCQSVSNLTHLLLLSSDANSTSPTWLHPLLSLLSMSRGTLSQRCQQIVPTNPNSSTKALSPVKTGTTSWVTTKYTSLTHERSSPLLPQMLTGFVSSSSGDDEWPEKESALASDEDSGITSKSNRSSRNGKLMGDGHVRLATIVPFLCRVNSKLQTWVYSFGLRQTTAYGIWLNISFWSISNNSCSESVNSSEYARYAETMASCSAFPFDNQSMPTPLVSRTTKKPTNLDSPS